MLTRALLIVAAVLALAGCGDSAKSKGSSPRPTATATPSGVTDAEVNALQLNTKRTEIIQRFGRPFDPQGVVPQKIIDGTPKNVTRCDYFHIRGGKPQDFAQLCFRGGELQSKLSLVTPKPAS